MSERTAENDATVETLVNAVLDEARGYRIDRAILTVALSRALPDAGLRERMEALADEFDAKGRRGSAHFGADIGDTIRLWIERDPRVVPNVDENGAAACRYPCGCDQFPDEHCACMDGHRRCSRCWEPWHPAGTACVIPPGSSAS